MNRPTRIVTKQQIYTGYHVFFTSELEVPRLDSERQSYLIKREMLKTKDSVLVLLYARAIDSFIFCQQFRTGVFFNDTEDDPFILECVAGAIDKGSPEDTAVKEVFEETGIKISDVSKIASVYKSPGIVTEKCHLFYGEVSNSPESGFFGVDDEDIKTHVIHKNVVYKLMDEMKILDQSTLLALLWFRGRDCL